MKTLFLDESGVENINTINPQYSAIGIGGAIFDELKYISTENKKVDDFKLDVFGTKDIVLHSYKIGKKEPPFDSLRNATKFDEFIAKFNKLIIDLDFAKLCILSL